MAASQNGSGWVESGILLARQTVYFFTALRNDRLAQISKTSISPRRIIADRRLEPDGKSGAGRR